MISCSSPQMSNVLSRLKDVVTRGSGWTALCPSHDDNRNSLSASLGDDGKVLLHCHAGCEFTSVVAALDLKPANLMPDKPAAKPASGFNIVAEHDYRDSDSTLRYQVVRLDPKDFRQRKPDGSGGWTWKVRGLKPVPYRLPQLAHGPGDASVFIVEGEKDADRLGALGLLATTNSGGAGKWPTDADYLGWFKDREVVVLPDNDDAGEKHGKSVAASLYGIASDVRIVRLPGLPLKGDVSDWLDAGGTVEELLEIVGHSPSWEPCSDLVPVQPHAACEMELSVGKPEGQTELANSKRFVKRFGNDAKFVATWGKWLVWRGSRWEEDVSNVSTMQFAKLVAQGVFDEARDCLNDGTIDFAKKTARLSGCRAMLNLAASDLAIKHDVLDQSPLLLNCPNGTVDLRTGILHPHRREDFLTKQVRVPFNPDAKCPMWEQFIGEVFPSPKLAAFAQRLVGYGLSGDVSEQVLPIFWGVGANGKSTLLTTIQWILQDYAGQAPASLLAVKKGDQHPTEVAGLYGKRFVVASETEGNCKLAEVLVKQLTGGDIISARRMREDFWTFNPTHKLVLCTNHRPRVSGTDHGIWRRLLLVPFTEVFDGPRKDPQLPAKLATEAEGILAWALRGCLEWQRDGLKPPEEVQAATQEYRSSEDVVGRFVMERCEVGSSSMSVKFSEFNAAFREWCEDSGERLPGQKTVAQWLTDNSFERHHSGGVKYRGICLKPTENGDME